MKDSSTQSARRGIITVLVGLTLAVLLQLGASQLVSAQQAPQSPVNIDEVAEFINKNSPTPISRIGSLAVGGPIPDWFNWNNNEYKCLQVGNGLQSFIDKMQHSCLDVSGTGTFQKLWVMPKTLVQNRVHVTSVGQLPTGGGGPGWEFPNAFVIEDIPLVTNDSMLISGLGRHSLLGQFQPMNTTSRRDVCATQNGILRQCTGNLSPVSGLCGFADGGSYAVAPVGEVLCETGTASAVTAIGGAANPQWRWTCTGAGTGALVGTCTAQRL